jgi:hypothetical protein
VFACSAPQQPEAGGGGGGGVLTGGGGGGGLTGGGGRGVLTGGAAVTGTPPQEPAIFHTFPPRQLTIPVPLNVLPLGQFRVTVNAEVLVGLVTVTSIFFGRAVLSVKHIGVDMGLYALIEGVRHVCAP